MKPIEVTLPCAVKMRVSDGISSLLSVELGSRVGMRFRDDGTVFMSVDKSNLPIFRDIIDTILVDHLPALVPPTPTFSQRLKFLFTGNRASLL